MKTAILLGATGLVGSELLKLLLAEDSVYDCVIIFVRKATEVTSEKLTQHIIDFDKIDDYSDLIVGDDLFCCLGTTIKKAKTQENFKKVDFEYPVRFAQIGKANGVKHFLLVSSIEANAQSSVFYTRTKGELEQAIGNIDFASASVFRPSALVGNRSEFRLGERLGIFLMHILSFLMIGKLRKYKSIKATQVAMAMYNVAQQNNVGFKIYESDEMQNL